MPESGDVSRNAKSNFRFLLSPRIDKSNKLIKTHGRKTANIAHLKEDDKVLFYLCGKDGYCFLGTGVLETSFGKLKESVIHEKYLDLVTGVSFRTVDPWTTGLPIKNLRGKVHFVPNGENYGCYIQGSVTEISPKDYETVIQEHNTIR